MIHLPILFGEAGDDTCKDCFNVDIPQNTFNHTGTYSFQIGCISPTGKSTYLGGYANGNYYVTRYGGDTSNEDLRIIICIAIVFLLLVFSVVMDNNWLGTIAGMGFLIVGLFFYTQGFGGISTLLSEGLGLIMIGVGTIFIFWSLRELVSVS
jgi:hypothetical protein